MIWFECDKCNKRHSRPETSCGSLIFCTCGHGIVVPWESTVAPAEEAQPAEVIPPLPPRLEPVPIDEERRLPRPRSREDRRPRRRRRDPAFCFNHTQVPSEKTCVACEEHFCSHCVVSFQGRILCGPCKNKEVTSLNRPPSTSSLAVVSVCLGMAAGPAGFCLLPTGLSTGMIILIILGMLVQILALVLGGLALYHTEHQPRLRGRSLAISGVTTAVVGLVLTVTLVLFSYLQWV